MGVVQAYRFALDVSPSQERAVSMFAGAGRFAHNVMLARVKAVMDQRAAERTYGISDEALTPALGWSLAAVRRVWNQAKDTVAPWWRECSKEAFNTGLDALARALKNWSDSCTGARAGRRVGFPRFKSRHRSTPTIRFTTGAIRVEPDRRHVVLPRMGRLKLHESARKLARRIEEGTARILSATVRRQGGRWFVSFTVDIERPDRLPDRPDAVVGVDVGVRHLAVLSTGVLVANPRHLDTALARLRRAGRVMARRRGPDRHTWPAEATMAGAAVGGAAAERDTAGSGPVAGRGAIRKTPNLGQEAKKRQPGATNVGKTGTVLPQGRTAA